MFRSCLGKTMALLEIKSLLSSVLANFDFELISDKEITYDVAIVLWVKNGLWVRAKHRNRV